MLQVIGARVRARDRSESGKYTLEISQAPEWSASIGKLEFRNGDEVARIIYALFEYSQQRLRSFICWLVSYRVRYGIDALCRCVTIELSSTGKFQG